VTALDPAARTSAAPLTPEQTHALASAVVDEVAQMIVGKRPVLEQVLLGILAGGHVLIEDLPGLGKTMLARSFASVLGLGFRRVQFTPDLLPQDLTGAVVYDQRSGELSFRPGPVFTNLLLADEINRTPPKTQAALLEAMAERQVTSDGETRALPVPFVVLATDNPIEYEGTYPLPEAQLDRFTIRVRLGYLDPVGEAAMVRRRLDRGAQPPRLRQLVDAAVLTEMVASLEQVHVHPDVLDYIVAIVQASRQHPKTLVGASPRGSLALTQLARGAAVLDGRSYVVPEDVKRVAVPVLGHRLVLRPELWVTRVGGDDIVAEILAEVPTPPAHPRAPA
jgi:MoxR-like ATPase